MANLLFTDVSLRALAAPPKGQVDYFDEALAGFGLRVSHKGTKAFFLLTGKKNNRRRQGLGRFGIISLSADVVEDFALLSGERGGSYLLLLNVSAEGQC